MQGMGGLRRPHAFSASKTPAARPLVGRAPRALTDHLGRFGRHVRVGLHPVWPPVGNRTSGNYAEALIPAFPRASI
jgi:hypothetical protein